MGSHSAEIGAIVEGNHIRNGGMYFGLKITKSPVHGEKKALMNTYGCV